MVWVMNTCVVVGAYVRVQDMGLYIGREAVRDYA